MVSYVLNVVEDGELVDVIEGSHRIQDYLRDKNDEEELIEEFVDGSEED